MNIICAYSLNSERDLWTSIIIMTLIIDLYHCCTMSTPLQGMLTSYLPLLRRNEEQCKLLQVLPRKYPALWVERFN